jgi:hypothetical protein
VPLFQLVLNIAVLILAIYQKPHRMGVGLAILFAGIPVYWLGVLWRNKPAEFTELVGRCSKRNSFFFPLLQKIYSVFRECVLCVYVCVCGGRGVWGGVGGMVVVVCVCVCLCECVCVCVCV